MTLAAALASTLSPSARADRPRHGGQPPLSRTLLAAGACWLLAMPAPAQSVDAPVAATDGVASAATSEGPAPRQSDRFYFQTSLYTAHFHPDDEHNNSQKLVYAEWRLPQRWLEGQVLVGGSYFDNSYYQSSQFVFAGLLWRPAESMQELYLKLAAGVVHGYKGQYQDKIPFNGSGYAPAIVPAVGYCYQRVCSELVLFGTAGAMLTLGVTLP